MKKIILVILTLLFIFCASCNDTQIPSESGSETGASTDKQEENGNNDESQSDSNANQGGNDESQDGTDGTPVLEKYTITWYDENGNKIKSETLEKGVTPSFSYSKSDTAEWIYTFVGWSNTQGGETLPSIPSVTEDTDYYAIVSRVKQKYTVTFNSNGGESVTEQQIEYGALATEPEAPKYKNHKLVSWCTDKECNNSVDWSTPITGNVTYYAKWNELVDISALLKALLEGYKLDPYSYIPQGMRLDYEESLVDSSEVNIDYSSLVNVSKINTGFGEQWHMILDNLEQTKLFFNVLSVVEGLATSSIASFNDYLDKNPSETAHHTLANGIYSITIDYNGEFIYYVIEYEKDLPMLGVQAIQIALCMDIETGERIVRIQLGDANALMYKILNNSYEFAIKYLGVRRAYFQISRDENENVSGHIYEYLTASDMTEIASSADFYITKNYATAIGNKADGLVGFTGYISELYNVTSGELLGYEVQETLSKIVYNTLWFDLSSIEGINSIKYQPKTDSSEEMFFVNGSSTAWEAKNVGGISLKSLSRRFDIEFRTQYVYSFDATKNEYAEHKIQVPMIFVQEEVYNEFVSDVATTNGVEISVLINSVDFSKLLSDYDTLIPVFIQNKELVTPEIIINYIGEKISFN